MNKQNDAFFGNVIIFLYHYGLYLGGCFVKIT